MDKYGFASLSSLKLISDIHQLPVRIHGPQPTLTYKALLQLEIKDNITRPLTPSFGPLQRLEYNTQAAVPESLAKNIYDRRTCKSIFELQQSTQIEQHSNDWEHNLDDVTSKSTAAKVFKSDKCMISFD